jgi:hypothetical protein
LSFTHLVGHLPPQFTSVSVPFWVLSVQLGVAQVPVVPALMTHHAFLQSASALQILPSSQAVVSLRQLGPPQSLSVSS